MAEPRKRRTKTFAPRLARAGGGNPLRPSLRRRLEPHVGRDLSAGQLGIEGAAEASAEVEWTKATGLKLDAEGHIHAEPKLKFTLSGFALVEADLVTEEDDESYDEKYAQHARQYLDHLGQVQ